MNKKLLNELLDNANMQGIILGKVLEKARSSRKSVREADTLSKIVKELVYKKALTIKKDPKTYQATMRTIGNSVTWLDLVNAVKDHLNISDDGAKNFILDSIFNS